MRLISWRQWALVSASAILQIVCFPLAGPVPLWRSLLSWVCLVPLLIALLDTPSGKAPLKPLSAAAASYVCGVFWYLGNCYWIYQTMYLYGGLPKPASLGILILFSLYLGLYHALFGGLVSLARRVYSVQFALCLSPILWVAVELARDRITGFPWDLLGYTQVDNLLLTRLATLTGVMGLSFVVAFGNALWSAVFLLPGKRAQFAWGGGALLVALCAILSAYGASAHPGGVSATATLIQENLTVGKETPSTLETRDQMLSTFGQLTLKPRVLAPASDLPAERRSNAAPQLLVWPEAPTLFVDSDPVFRASIGALARRLDAPAIVDAVSIGQRRTDGQYNEYNSASFFLADGSYAGRYDKMHLVPFGEYTPYKPLFFFAGHLLDNLPFVPGKSRKLLIADGKRYGVFICYESIFGDEIRRFVSDGAEVLVNISDDGWYGDTSAPWEHLDMVRMRAIENDRWLLRATNTGVTAAIDPHGIIRAELPRHVRSSIEVGFNYRTDLTFYTLHGDWIGWLCVVTGLGALAFGELRFRRNHEYAVK